MKQSAIEIGGHFIYPLKMIGSRRKCNHLDFKKHVDLIPIAKIKLEPCNFMRKRCYQGAVYFSDLKKKEDV